MFSRFLVPDTKARYPLTQAPTTLNSLFTGIILKNLPNLKLESCSQSLHYLQGQLSGMFINHVIFFIHSTQIIEP